MKIPLIHLFFTASLFICGNVYSQTIINIADYGGKANNRQNILPALKQALEACKEHDNITLKFPKGRYDFWPILTQKKKERVGRALKKPSLSHPYL